MHLTVQCSSHSQKCVGAITYVPYFCTYMAFRACLKITGFTKCCYRHVILHAGKWYKNQRLSISQVKRAEVVTYKIAMTGLVNVHIIQTLAVVYDLCKRTTVSCDQQLSHPCTYTIVRNFEATHLHPHITAYQFKYTKWSMLILVNSIYTGMLV